MKKHFGYHVINGCESKDAKLEFGAVQFCS
jgi:hypothetical protein